MSVRQTVGKGKHAALLAARRAYSTLRPPNIPRRFLHKGVAYYSQWESPDLNGKIVDGTLRARSDPNWRRSGAKTVAEYEAWSWNMCGMACLKMLLQQCGKGDYPVVALGKLCTAYGGYSMPLHGRDGLQYKPFVRFLAKEFDLQATSMAPMTLSDVTQAVARGKYVIASVSSEIRDPGSQPTHKGGHLVLVLGYDLDKAEVYFHNPSGVSRQTQSYACVSMHEFNTFFAFRGVIVVPPRMV